MQPSMWWPCIASMHRCLVQLAIPQDAQVLSSRAALMLVTPQSIPLLGAVLSQEQDFAFVFTELHEVSVGPFWIQAPGKQCNSQDRRSGQQIGAAFPHRKQPLTTVSHRFLFATQVLPSDQARPATTPPPGSREHFLWKMNSYWPGAKLCFCEHHALPWKNYFSFNFKECDKKVWGQVKLIYFWTEWYKRKYRVIS